MDIIEKVKIKAKTFFENDGGGHHDWDHTLQVCSLCEKIGRHEKKDKMLTTEGRRIAENRHKYMKEFFEKLDREIAVID